MRGEGGGGGGGSGWKEKGGETKDDQKQPYNTGVSERKAMCVDMKSCPPSDDPLLPIPSAVGWVDNFGAAESDTDATRPRRDYSSIIYFAYKLHAHNGIVLLQILKYFAYFQAHSSHDGIILRFRLHAT